MSPDLDWVEAFRRRHGRSPRVLHVGNVANNAYLNAKLLNARGFDCDVICHDYLHIMGCPEWEDAEFRVEGLDQGAPDWVAAGARGFKRPRWFAQGPQLLCLDYLLAKRQNKAELADLLWHQLGVLNGTVKADPDPDPELKPGWGPALARWIDSQVLPLLATAAEPVGRIGRRAGSYLRAIASHPNPRERVVLKLHRLLAPQPTYRQQLLDVLIVPAALGFVGGVKWGGRLASYFRNRGVHAASADVAPIERVDPTMERTLKVIQRFKEIFPERKDQLSLEDCVPYHGVIERWGELFGYYDVVQAYATCVMYPLLAGFRDYVGFEHGTLRDFTLANSPVARLTSLGYQTARHSLITNGDCLAYAQKIKVASAIPMIHPIDDDRLRALDGDPAGIRRRHGVRHLFFCPLRHDWAVKGTDQYIRALPGIVRLIGPDFKVLMTKWGSQLEQSIELARELGVLEQIAWIDPLSRAEMVRLQKSVDIIFDQIALPHFGATAPQAIATGTPVIMSYDPAYTEWIIPQPAPILAAWNPEEVVTAVGQALDPGWRAEYRTRAQQWYSTHHSSSVVVDILSRVYRDIIENPLQPQKKPV